MICYFFFIKMYVTALKIGKEALFPDDCISPNQRL